jgi:hypothetical protein
MKNIKMLNYFDNTFTSKLNYEYKNKTLLNIISNFSELKKNNSFNTNLNTKLQLLNKIEKKILNNNSNSLINNSLTNNNNKYNNNNNNNKNSNSLTNTLLTINSLNNNLLNNRSLFSSNENDNDNDNDKKLSNINKELINKNNIMIPRIKQNIINQTQINKNLITRIKNIDNNLKNNINLPLNIIGKPALNLNLSTKNYLNLITKFNPEIAKVKNTLFNFNLTNNKILKNVYTILEYSFKSMNSLISKPYIYINQDKIIIHLFFFIKVLPTFKFFNNNNINNRKGKNNFNINKFKSNLKSNLPFLTVNKIKLENLCALLSIIFNKKVVLDLTQLHRPYHEANILVNALGLIANKIKLRRILKKLFKAVIIKNPTRLINRKRFSVLPCIVAGLSVKVAGRLLTQRVIPRRTVKFNQKGSLSRTKSVFIENARFTNKNKRGSFSITVASGYYL